MTPGTFVSKGQTYKITVNGTPATTGKSPVVMFIHGNFGLGPPYGAQIGGFATDLNRLGYVTAVPQYYTDDAPHLMDTTPHVQTLADAVAFVTARPDADPTRVGLIGFSLGGATAMSYIASQPPDAVKALADFFGFLTDEIRREVTKFPPAILFHNKNDQIVPVTHSRELDRLLPAVIEHRLVEYDEHWQQVNHAFQPGGAADVDSRAQATKWFLAHLPPTVR